MWQPRGWRAAAAGDCQISRIPEAPVATQQGGGRRYGAMVAAFLPAVQGNPRECFAGLALAAFATYYLFSVVKVSPGRMRTDPYRYADLALLFDFSKIRSTLKY